eukprot:13404132-Alexandrium_andersonii.AAC.1
MRRWRTRLLPRARNALFLEKIKAALQQISQREVFRNLGSADALGIGDAGDEQPARKKPRKTPTVGLQA